LIPLRDSDPAMINRVGSLGNEISASIVSRVELEGGVYRDASQALRRRANLDNLLAGLRFEPFAESHAAIYGDIIATIGYSRRKLLDRMIAAQALAINATLVTLNPGDFSDVPGLKLLAW